MRLWNPRVIKGGEIYRLRGVWITGEVSKKRGNSSPPMREAASLRATPGEA